VTAQQDCRDNLLFYASLVEPLKTGLSTKLELTPIVTNFEGIYKGFSRHHERRIVIDEKLRLYNI
jgi:hypothetical protein